MMKPIYKTLALCLLSLPFSMAVQAAEHNMQNMQGMGQHGGMQGMGQHEGMQGMGQGQHAGMQGMGGMGGMHGDMMAEMMSPEHLKEKQAHLLMMHDLSNKILAEKDPAKQQVLKDQQLLVMKAHMAKHHKMQMSHPAPPPPPAPEKK